MKTRTPTRPRRVKFLEDPEDLRVLLLGLRGKSTSCILGQTDLTVCQVLYRLQQARRLLDCAPLRSNYRNSLDTPYDRMVLAANGRVEDEIRKELSVALAREEAAKRRAATVEANRLLKKNKKRSTTDIKA